MAGKVHMTEKEAIERGLIPHPKLVPKPVRPPPVPAVVDEKPRRPLITWQMTLFLAAIAGWLVGFIMGLMFSQ